MEETCTPSTYLAGRRATLFPVKGLSSPAGEVGHYHRLNVTIDPPVLGVYRLRVGLYP